MQIKGTTGKYGTDGSSTSTSSASKFSSITPSTYRPSYSSTSGTYRASRAPPVSSTTTSTPKSYTRTYTTLGKISDDEKDKQKSYTRTYSNLGRNENDNEKSSKPYTRSYTTLSGSKTSDDKDKKEPSPPKRVSSRYVTKDLSAETRTRLSSTYGNSSVKKDEKGPPITFNTRYKVASSTRGRSRDPSPATDNNNQPQTALQRLSAARDRSRDPSPAVKGVSTYSKLSTGSRSRDPSPSSLSKSYSDNLQNKNILNRSYSNSTANGSNGYSNSSLLNSQNKVERSYTSSISTSRNASREPSPSLSTIRPSITSAYPRSRDPSPVDSKYLSPQYRLSNGREKSRDPSPSITTLTAKLRESSPLSGTSRYSSSSINHSSTSPQARPTDISISYMTASEASSRPSRASFINRYSPQKDKSMIPLKIDKPTTPENLNKKQQKKESESESSSSEDSDSDESDVKSKKSEPKIMIQVTTITRGTSPTPTSTVSSGIRSRRAEVAKMIEKVRERPLQGPPMCDKSTQSDRMDDSTRYSRFGSTSSFASYSSSPTNYSSRYSSNLGVSNKYSRETSESISANETDKEESCDISRGSSAHKSGTESSESKERSLQSKSKTPESGKMSWPQSPPARTDSSKSNSSKVSNKDFRKSALNMGPTDRTRRSKSSSSENSSLTVEKTRMQFQQLLNSEIQKAPSISRSSSTESDSSTESLETQSQIERKPSEAQNHPTKEEIISHKVEEAKSFLLKTLGKPANSQWLNGTRTESPCATESSEKSKMLDLDFSNLQKSISGEKPWWMDDKQETHDTEQNTEQLDNNFSELTINETTRGQNEQNSTKYLWANGETNSLTEGFQKLKRPSSEEKPWWCQSPENKQTSDNHATATNLDNGFNSNWEQETQADISELQQDDEIRQINRNFLSPMSNVYGMKSLGDRASPEGLESHLMDRKSLHDSMKGTNYHVEKLTDFNARPRLFISKHTNIDDILGGSSVFSSTSLDLALISPEAVRIHGTNSPPKIILKHKNDENGNEKSVECAYDDNCHRNVEAENGKGSYSSCKTSPLLQSPLGVRVHGIIEKLLTSEGKELRRALFSLKQIFQEDQDLVHGFVALGGLNCLVTIGKGADQNFQNFILRALGQVMLYVDGMSGVMEHSPTVQWLYMLIESKYRLVVKTALKLLLVFVEYCEGNCYLLVNAISKVDSTRGTLPWSSVMKLLKDYENADTELLIYATSLINKTLSGLNDQDSFYNETDFLEDQGMENVIKRYTSRISTDLDLLDQFQFYEAALRFEDDVSDGIVRLMDNSIRRTLKKRSSSLTPNRKSRRYNSTINIPPPPPPPVSLYQNVPPPVPSLPLSYMLQQHHQTPDNDSSSSGGGDLNGFGDLKIRDGGAGVTPGLRRRRAERQKTFHKDSETGMNSLKQQDSDDDCDTDNEDKKLLLQMNREQTVKDLAQKLSNLPLSPQEDKSNRIGDMSGLISKAKEELEKSRNRPDIKTNVENDLKKPEAKKSEIELHWEELVKNMDRDLTLCDLDFTDLTEDDEVNILAARGVNGSASIPPPPPPNRILQNQTSPLSKSNEHQNGDSLSNDLNEQTIKKTKKTVKLFWKEVREDMIPSTIGQTIWDELPKANVDIMKLEHLFESRAKDLLTKKQQELNKNKEVIVLDHKRSNAINIAMTKLPPPRAIKTAILKMDSTVVTREGIDKILYMLPTEEERGKIQEAQLLSPDLPLGSAEQFLLTLSSISELAARLKLWAFKLDFENIEKEIAEPLMDLKVGIDLLKSNLTFKCILSHLLTVGCFLNGQVVKGFQIEYLSKVPEVKDTVQKHSLLHHLCCMVIESSPSTTDLYSEIGPITRASKADFSELAHNIKYLETECKTSWDRLKLISRHETSTQLKQKLIDFLADCAERIIILDTVHRRVINRYRKFLLWLGVSPHRIAESRPNEFCRILSEFALEYRTTRERVYQQIENKTNLRDRHKMRGNGKLVLNVVKTKSGIPCKISTKEEEKDAELRQLLGTTPDCGGEVNGTLNFRRRRQDNLRSPSISNRDENFPNGNDDGEIMESIVKSVSKNTAPRQVQRERKRSRNADRKALVKRSRTREGFTPQRSPSPG
ncbi:CLUMA_CG016177, isoform A [Clunio marinus]|uniref:CLUMA_CG016177, isoform A n=1 Tax=Clunio marinus TaxID=568069 RepID=A0A1J1IUB5_9DIPT|nr:CLUMA_CG016177, isoform A [Clunio marinus]